MVIIVITKEYIAKLCTISNIPMSVGTYETYIIYILTGITRILTR